MRLSFSVPGLLLAVLLASGCPKPDDTSALAVDADGDGYTEQDGDCDDEAVGVYPGAWESCNGVDDDCDGLVDEELPDADGDGTCDALDEEECDGQDNDGDGLTDEDFGDSDDDGVADCIDEETCDGQDNDGDGLVDEDTADTDEDGI